MPSALAVFTLMTSSTLLACSIGRSDGLAPLRMRQALAAPELRDQLEPGLAAWFLEPNDTAVSKYARMEPRDREWIRAGLQAGILSLPILDARFARTAFRDPAESARARTALDEDRAWLARRAARRCTAKPRRFTL